MLSASKEAERSPARKKTSFVKQAAILAAAGILSRFIGFLYRVPLTALIGDEGNAIYAAGYNIYNFMLILSSAGLPAAISKMVSERAALKRYRGAHEVFRVSLLASGVLGLLLMLILLVFPGQIASAVDSPDSKFAIMTLAPNLFIVAIMSCFRGYFQGMNKMKPTAVSQVIEQIFNATTSVLLAYILVKKSVALGAAGGTAGTGIGALFGLIAIVFIYGLAKPDLHRRIKTRSAGEERESRLEILRILIRTAFPIIAGTAVFSITNLIDMKMVLSRLNASGAFTEKEALILYGQLSGKYVVLTTMPVSISTALATASVPNIAASVVRGEKSEVNRKINLAFKIAMIISIPAAVGIGILGDQILLLLYPSYPGGGMLLKIGALSVIFLALCQIITGILQGIGKVHIPVISAVCGALVKIILNYVLIINPAINVYGAVISTTACYMTASGINLWFLTKFTGVFPNLGDNLLKPAAAAAIMGAVCFGLYKLLFILTSSNTLSTLIAILISMGVYTVALLWLKGLTRDEVASLPKGEKLNALFKRFRLI